MITLKTPLPVVHIGDQLLDVVIRENLSSDGDITIELLTDAELTTNEDGSFTLDPKSLKGLRIIQTPTVEAV